MPKSIIKQPLVNSTIQLPADEVERIKNLLESERHETLLSGVGGFVRHAIMVWTLNPKRTAPSDVTTRSIQSSKISVGLQIPVSHRDMLKTGAESFGFKNYGAFVRHLTLLEIERRENGETAELPPIRMYKPRQPARVVAKEPESQPAASPELSMASLFCCDGESDDD